LNEGDLVLVAARPRAGKTVFASGLLAQAQQKKRPKGHLFTLVESEHDARKRFDAKDLCWIDCADDISADYIIASMQNSVEPGSLIVVDYLQMLDEKRTNPPLQEQISALQVFAKTTGCIIVFLCQLDRQIGERLDQRPTIADVRLPNPLDLKFFNKILFLYRESPEAELTEVSFAGHEANSFKVTLA
jgi:replicative DNA helicase